MEKRIQIGLVGDFNENIKNLTAVPESIGHCKPRLHFAVEEKWLATETIDDNFLATHTYEGFWLVPGSPYKNDDGVYKLIRWARENNFPLLGSCGGFQYMLVEYARNILNIAEAGHQETEPANRHLIISRLSCSLKGAKEEVLVTDKKSWLYDVLKTERLTGFFNCNYGLNPVYQSVLNQYPLVFTAAAESGEARAFELKAHRFYCATVFQPALDSSAENPNPLVLDFLKKCSHY
jgi:CTP synthase (UTP-ammonia lyase)